MSDTSGRTPAELCRQWPALAKLGDLAQTLAKLGRRLPLAQRGQVWAPGATLEQCFSISEATLDVA